MIKFTSVLLVFPIIAAQSALAQDLDGVFAEGYLEGSYVDDGSADDTFFGIDVDMGFRPYSSGIGGPVGGSFGVEYFSNDSADIEAFYGSLDIRIGPGTLSLGSPRSVYDRGYATEHQIGLSTYTDTVLGPFTSSTYRSIYYLSDGKTRGGLRWDGEYGDTQIGASYNQYELSGADIDSTALAVRHNYGAFGQFDQISAFAAVELVDGAPSTDTNFLLGTEVDFGQWNAGLSYNRTEAIVDANTVEAFANYTFDSGLQIDASLASIDSTGGDAMFYGLAARYEFSKGLFFDASYVGSDQSGNSDLVDLSVGFNF